jgi:hypothetical protein
MRRFTKVTGRVFFNASTNFDTTAIQSVQATRFGSNVGFVVNVPDAERVLVLFRDASPPVNGSIKWKSVELAKDAANPSRWTGGSPIVGQNIEWLVQALSLNGNVATSSNKARYFDAAAAPTGGAIDVTLAGPGTSPYFTGAVTVTATGPAGVALSRRLDGVAGDYTGPFEVTTDGLHTVEFTGTDGSTGARSFVIDTTTPGAPIIVVPPTPTASYTLGQLVLADFRCRDTGSGVLSCGGPVTPGTSSVQNGQPLPTNSIGTKTVTVTATDFVGHTGPSATRSYKVIWAFDGFFPPVDNPPVLNVVGAGQSVPVRFSLGGDFGLGILAAGSPSSVRIPCDSDDPPDDIEQTTTAPTGLSFLAGQYTFVWRTEKSWRGQCRRFTLTLVDGTAHVADFRFK